MREGDDELHDEVRVAEQRVGTRGYDESFDAAFGELYPRARRLAQRILGDLPSAEDAAAEAMVRTLLHWRRVAALPHRDAWVLRVTTNLALDVVRRRNRRGASSPSSGDTIPGAADALDQAVLRIDLAEAVATLPRRQREVVVLIYLVGLPTSEVANVLSISMSSVGQHARRALAKLREVADPAWIDVDLPERGSLAANA